MRGDARARAGSPVSVGAAAAESDRARSVGRPVRRRSFLGGSAAGLAAGGVALATGSLAGCGFVHSDRSPSSRARTLSFTTWGTDSELAGFRDAVARFETAHPGSRVELNPVPYEHFFTNIDAQLQSGTAPDLFRVDYDTFGTYAGRGQLLDLGPYLGPRFGDRFTPALRESVRFAGRPYGVPHHTDTSVLLYDRRALADAGISDPPTTTDRAWTWDEFAAVATRLRERLPADRYPFVVNWQSTGVTRWLNWLFQAGGRYLGDDLTTPVIDSAPGRAAVEFTRSFFPRRWVPPNSSVRSTTYASDIWYAGTAAMTFAGAYLIPDAAATVDFDWAATPAPRQVRAGGDLGGNALVATAGTGKPAVAAAFLDLITQHDPMRDFCARASLLPTRRDLVAGDATGGAGLAFLIRPELTPVFAGQAAAVTTLDAAQIASPAMAEINAVLTEQLEQAFVGDRSTDAVLAGLTTGIAAATARTR